jgi:hypothetical protein
MHRHFPAKTKFSSFKKTKKMKRRENFTVTDLEYLYIKKFVEYMRPRIPPIFEMTFKTFEDSSPQELRGDGWYGDMLDYGAPICQIWISFSRKVPKKIKEKILEFRHPDCYRGDDCIVEFELLSNCILYVFNNVFCRPDPNAFPSIRYALRGAFGPLAYKTYDWSLKNIPAIMEEWKSDWEEVAECCDDYAKKLIEKREKKNKVKESLAKFLENMNSIYKFQK